MEQSQALQAPTVDTSELSPEFIDWLESEKADAREHQHRIVKATALVVIGLILFLLKQQPTAFAGLF